jgi:hypothetical protein
MNYMYTKLLGSESVSTKYKKCHPLDWKEKPFIKLSSILLGLSPRRSTRIKYITKQS